MQLAAHVELDQARHVDAEMVGAHRRALDLALAQEIEAVQLDLLAERDHADDGRGAAGRQHRKGLLGGFLAAQHLEGMMHAAAGEFAHLLHHVAVPGIDDVGGAEFGRKLQLGRVGIDRDDAAGARDLARR